MPILKISKGYLDFIGKDATLLSIAIFLLFVENTFQYSFGKSLINNEKIDFEKLLNFKFILGFVVFIFTCKLLFLFYSPLISHLPVENIGFTTSYKVGFGCFILALLLFSHAYLTNESNSFLQVLSSNKYRATVIALGLISLIFASICDWSGNETKVDSK